MKDLIAKLEAATGPSRELDRMIHDAIDPEDMGAPPFYTAELAAALLTFKDRSPRGLVIAALRSRDGGN